MSYRPYLSHSAFGNRVALPCRRRCWSELTPHQVFIWSKLLTGAFRVGVPHQLVGRALAEVSGLDVEVVAHRLMGE